MLNVLDIFDQICYPSSDSQTNILRTDGTDGATFDAMAKLETLVTKDGLEEERVEFGDKVSDE